MSWTSFKDAADKALGQKGMNNQIEKTLLLEQANKILLDILGQESQDKFRAMYFRGSTLTIAVLDDGLLYKMETSKEQLIKKINSYFGKNIVDDCQFLN
ncbi:DUF721 domain-containing protein [Patescibacteria group bacterium]|nr:DUF721 domain-containing protein [Patescibacteria group bacterium]